MMWSDSGGVSQITGVRMRVLGDGTILATLNGPEGLVTTTYPSKIILPTSVNNIWFPTNFVQDSAALSLVFLGSPGSFLISRIWLYGTELWATRPA
jgi:hypothetical protein